jgi:hypothetical protein
MVGTLLPKIGGKNVNFKTMIILFSILGIGVLYFIATLSQPQNIEFSDIIKFKGKQVVVTGIVVTYYSTSVGGQIIKLQDRNATIADSSVILFVQETTPVEYGDVIQATGKVQKYKEMWEIVVTSALDIHVVQKCRNISSPLWQLAENPLRYIGMNLTVEGNVDTLSGKSFSLEDLEKKYVLFIVSTDSVVQTIFPGDTVVVSGIFMYDAEHFRYVLRMNQYPSSLHRIQQE